MSDRSGLRAATRGAPLAHAQVVLVLRHRPQEAYRIHVRAPRHAEQAPSGPREIIRRGRGRGEGAANGGAVVPGKKGKVTDGEFNCELASRASSRVRLNLPDGLCATYLKGIGGRKSKWRARAQGKASSELGEQLYRCILVVIAGCMWTWVCLSMHTHEQRRLAMPTSRLRPFPVVGHVGRPKPCGGWSRPLPHCHAMAAGRRAHRSLHSAPRHAASTPPAARFRSRPGYT